MSPPTEVTLELEPRARFDLIDVRARVAAELKGFLREYRRAVYCSHHTTAGYLEQSLCARLDHSPTSVHRFMGVFQRLFPPNADYQHDQLHLRSELSDEQRRHEPRNGDSHLAFIGSGLRSCVTYANRDDTPVYFIDLDGVYEQTRRRRRTTVLGYNREEEVARLKLKLPLSDHAVDSLNLRDPRLGVYQELQDMVHRLGLEAGRVDIALAPSERNAALTVNEYETLLMKHDMAEVLRNPVRFMAEKGRNILLDPRAVPYKTLNYAKYDFVQVLNEFLDAVGMGNSALERVVDKFMAIPASRFLRMKRSVSLLVANQGNGSQGHIVQGTYQSPILVQWEKAPRQSREIEAIFRRFA
jgi:thiamine phosphate synthase YjbQ (UPF0047 family)